MEHDRFFLQKEDYESCLVIEFSAKEISYMSSHAFVPFVWCGLVAPIRARKDSRGGEYPGR